MNDIIHGFGSVEIRFVSHPKDAYAFGIVAIDLALILEASSGKDIARSVDDEWKGEQIMHTPGGNQSVTVIWEPGVYQLLSKSRKPQAKPFQKWLFEEVLPSIRKTGSYQANPEPIALPQRDTIDYVLAAKTLEEMGASTLTMLLRDCLIDELELKRNNKALPMEQAKKQYTIVKVRAKQLGYTHQEIKDGAALGRFVKSQIEPAYQEMIGRYPVFHYEITPALDTAIHTFFGVTE